MKSGNYLAIVGGIIAIAGQFINTENQYFFPLIGGLMAVVGGFMAKQ